MFEDHNREPFSERLWLASPTMHGEELEYMKEAYETNWMSTVGENINAVEREVCAHTGSAYAVALSSGTASLHLSLRLAGHQVYGEQADASGGTLKGKRVFCSDMTFDATVNPVVYEGGIPVFIDTEPDTWNMDPRALERAFLRYPDVRLVVAAHLYGTPGKMRELRAVMERFGAVFVEDAAESFGAAYEGRQTGTFGCYNTISFNGNKIITGSSGGCFLTDSREAADLVRKWSTQAREPADWYEHEQLGYNYRMSNVVAGIVRGQLLHLEEHISRKKEIYLRYREGFQGLPVSMNPMDLACSTPNYWLSCLLIHPEGMCRQIRSGREAMYEKTPGKSCPTEILAALASINAEGRPIWKPMHSQPIYRNHLFVKAEDHGPDVGMDIFHRGLCLPSDIKMTREQQDIVIEVVRACFA